MAFTNTSFVFKWKKEISTCRNIHFSSGESIYDFINEYTIIDLTETIKRISIMYCEKYKHQLYSGKQWIEEQLVRQYPTTNLCGI